MLDFWKKEILPLKKVYFFFFNSVLICFLREIQKRLLDKHGRRAKALILKMLGVLDGKMPFSLLQCRTYFKDLKNPVSNPFFLIWEQNAIHTI